MAVARARRAAGRGGAPGDVRGGLRAGRGDLRQRRRGDRQRRRAGRCTRWATTASSPSRTRRCWGSRCRFVEDFEFDNGYVSPYMVTDPGHAAGDRRRPVHPLLGREDQATCSRSCRCSTRSCGRAQAAGDRRGEGRGHGAADARAQPRQPASSRPSRSRRPASVRSASTCWRTWPRCAAARCTSQARRSRSSRSRTEHLGRAAQVRVTSENTTIIGGARRPRGRSSCGWPSCAPSWRGRRSAPTRTSSPTRIARLSGKAAIISVGAPTNAEAKEVRHRVDDSLQATRAAIAEGIVAGGGAALLHAEPVLDRLRRRRRLPDRRGDRAQRAHRARCT